SGIWPPSNPSFEKPFGWRAFCPFMPLPAVFPRPEPGPRPLRRGVETAPAGGRRRERIGVVSSVFVVLDMGFLHGDEVQDLFHHAAKGRCVLRHDRAIDPAQTEALQNSLLNVGTTDRAACLRDLELRCHGYDPYAWISAVTVTPRRCSTDSLDCR